MESSGSFGKPGCAEKLRCDDLKTALDAFDAPLASVDDNCIVLENCLSEGEARMDRERDLKGCFCGAKDENPSWGRVSSAVVVAVVAVVAVDGVESEGKAESCCWITRWWGSCAKVNCWVALRGSHALVVILPFLDVKGDLLRVVRFVRGVLGPFGDLPRIGDRKH